MKRIAIVLLVLAACVNGEHREARDKYNEGVGDLVKGDLDAAEKALLDARSGAGVDPELRFRAAYDLGMAYSAHAEKTKGGKDADLGKALEQEQEAVSWFSDALRLRPADADTIANLAVVRARAAAISDDLRKGEGKLEARLDAAIGEQRGVLDEGRGAWMAVRQGGGSDPLAQQAALTKLADRERGIVAEVGTIGDLASDEIDAIGKKKDDKRDPKEQVRMVQLKNLDLYLLDARARIAEARRKLQELAAEDGVARAEAALAALKRAREQLLDPIAVLGEVAQDEVQIYQEAVHVAPEAHGLAGIGSAGSAAAAAADVPGWLAPSAMAERQNGLRDRLEEVRARLAAGVDAADKRAAGQGAGSGEPPPKPPTAEEQKLIERVRTALPFVVAASGAMDRARIAFGASKLPDATAAQEEALVALGRAIEEFSDLKHAIELAYQHHQETLGYLSPDAAKQLAPAERAKKTLDAVTANRARLERIAGLLADEQAQLDQQKLQLDAKLAQAGSGSGAGSGAAAEGAAAKAQLAQAGDQLKHAEELREQAAAALAQLDTALAKNTDPMPPAHDAETKIEELRELFFSVIEHLQELVRAQGETRDQTSASVTEDDFTRAPKLPPLIARQDQHAAMAKAITDALAKQADAAGKAAQQPQQGPTKPKEGPDPKALAGAADEVRKAQTDMADAHTAIDKSAKATNVSVPLQPAVDSQGKAIEHLEAALKLLQPPQQNKDDKDQQKQDQQKQKQDQQKKDQQKQQQQPQGGAGQRARDDDARRQRERRERGSASDAVDKDW